MIRGIITGIIIGVIVFFIIKNGKKSDTKAAEEKTDKNEELPDFEKEFFKRTEAGEDSKVLASVASQQDCALIRSLLQADNIPSYAENEHMNNIYGGVTGTMTSVVAIKLYVLSADYEKALEIVKNYNRDSSGVTIFEKE